MPKIIDDAKDKILTVARKQLFETGYGKMTLRSVASECSIAVGTIYNYFANKDILAASIIMEDWHHTLEKMREGCCKANSVEEGFRVVYEEITAFRRVYEKVWEQYQFVGSAQPGMAERHMALRQQIEDEINGLFVRFGLEKEEHLSPILAEMVLAAAMHPELKYEALSDVITRLFIMK